MEDGLTCSAEMKNPIVTTIKMCFPKIVKKEIQTEIYTPEYAIKDLDSWLEENRKEILEANGFCEGDFKLSLDEMIQLGIIGIRIIKTGLIDD